MKFHRVQRPAQSESPDSVSCVLETVSVYRIRVFLYLATLRCRQYAVLSSDPGMGEELAQAFGDARRKFAKSILRHIGVHYFVSYGGTKLNERQVLPHQEADHVASLGHRHSQCAVSGESVQQLRSGQFDSDGSDGADAQVRQLSFHGRKLALHVNLGSY